MQYNFPDAKMVFKLYQKDESKIESTFFDWISGDKETKQTKGLAYMLKLYPEILNELFKLKDISSHLKDIGFNRKSINNCDLIKIDAEMLASGESLIRRDITITFYNKNIKMLILIIEAKNIKLKNPGDLKKQLHAYFDSTHFPSDQNVPTLGISLTKFRYLYDDNALNLISITWSEIIDVLNKVLRKIQSQNVLNSSFLQEYLHFLLEVDKGMKFYEKEVLSVPAGGTIQQINNYHIHACPNDKNHSYLTPLYITFRHKGGIMKSLYQIGEIFVLSPHNQSYETVIKDSSLESKERILQYIEERKKNFGFEKKNCDYKFFVLSEKRKIDLPHNPQFSSTGHCYFSLPELLSGKKNVVVESREDEIYK